MRIWGWILAVLCLGCGSPKTPNDAIKVSLPNKHYFLANGLEVVLEPDTHSPYVAIRMRYHVGSKDDPPGRAGFAHLVEHMTFACGQHIGKDEVLDAYKRMGAIDLNGGTWLDVTDYYALVPSAQLEGALWIEAERMAFVAPALDKDTLHREIDVVGSERSQHYGNATYGWTWPMVQQGLFPDAHPYHRSTIGVASELAPTTPEEVAAFLSRYYVPDNATLVLVGDLQIENVVALVEKYFGTVPPGTAKTAPRSVPVLATPAHAVVRAEANVPYPLLVTSWLGPPTTSASFEDTRIALSYIAGALDFRNSLKGKSVTGSWVDGWGGRLTGIYTLTVQGERGTTFAELSDEVKHALWRVTTYSLSWWDISSPRSRAVSKVILGLEDLVDRSESTANGLERWGTADYAQPEIDNDLTITSSSVQSAAESILTADRAAFLWIEPNAGAPPAGRVIR